MVGMGALVQRPLAAVIARADVRRPRDLEGRRVGVTGLPSDDAVLRAVVETDGGDYAAVGGRDRLLGRAHPLRGKVDAVVSFWNAEGVALRERGFRTGVPCRRYGAPRYPELVLVATHETIDARDELLHDLLAAIAAARRRARRPRPGVSEMARVSDADEPWCRPARRVAPALARRCAAPRRARGLGGFDARFGILREAPDVNQAFRLR